MGVDPGRRLAIRRAVLDAIVAHARADAPLECCGLLVGAEGTIVDRVPARNAEASRTRYLVDPRDHFDAIRMVRGTTRRIVGAYHSHPGGPVGPSASDVRESPGADWIHVIVGLNAEGGAEVGAYTTNGQDVERLPLDVLD